MNELGIRYKCYKCHTKFYDLAAPQPICPSCGENQNNDESRKPTPKQRKKIFRLVAKGAADLPHEPGNMEEPEAVVHDEEAYGDAADEMDRNVGDQDDDAAHPEE